MNKAIVAVLAAALALGACHKDTPAENQLEKQADAIGDSYKADADVQRALAEGAPNENSENIQADRLEAQGKAIEKNLKKEADEMGKDTRKMEEGKPN